MGLRYNLFFFIDTAKNMLEYLEIIHSILKTGGLWINIGPLLYHYENMPGEISIELSLEQVKDVIVKIGFDFQVRSNANPQISLLWWFDVCLILSQNRKKR